MPAAARKRYPSVVPDEHARGAQRHAPAGRPLRNPNARRPAPLTTPAQRQVDERAESAYESSLETNAKARAARRKARRRHRPFRPTWQATVAVGILMSQLVALLWLQGVALSARNRSFKLDNEIADKYSAVTRTQKEIAGLDSATRIAAWANERGWQVASQDKLDSVTNLTPVTEAAPAAAAPAVAANTTLASKHKAHRNHKKAPVKVEVQVTNEPDATGNGVSNSATVPATNSQTPNDNSDNSANSAQAGDD